MADSLSPWIEEYLLSVALEYGANLSSVPWSSKKRKVQIIEFITFGSTNIDEDSLIWGSVSDKTLCIPTRFSREAVAEYRRESRRRLTVAKTAVVSLRNFRVIHCRVPLKRNSAGETLSKHGCLALECTSVSLIGSLGEPPWGNFSEVSSHAQLQEWNLGLRQPGGAGNVLKERKNNQSRSNAKEESTTKKSSSTDMRAGSSRNPMDTFLKEDARSAKPTKGTVVEKSGARKLANSMGDTIAKEWALLWAPAPSLRTKDLEVAFDTQLRAPGDKNDNEASSSIGKPQLEPALSHIAVPHESDSRRPASPIEPPCKRRRVASQCGGSQGSQNHRPPPSTPPRLSLRSSSLPLTDWSPSISGTPAGNALQHQPSIATRLSLSLPAPTPAQRPVSPTSRYSPEPPSNRSPKQENMSFDLDFSQSYSDFVISQPWLTNPSRSPEQKPPIRPHSISCIPKSSQLQAPAPTPAQRQQVSQTADSSLLEQISGKLLSSPSVKSSPIPSSLPLYPQPHKLGSHSTAPAALISAVTRKVSPPPQPVLPQADPRQSPQILVPNSDTSGTQSQSQGQSQSQSQSQLQPHLHDVQPSKHRTYGLPAERSGAQAGHQDAADGLDSRTDSEGDISDDGSDGHDSLFSVASSESMQERPYFGSPADSKISDACPIDRSTIEDEKIANASMEACHGTFSEGRASEAGNHNPTDIVNIADGDGRARIGNRSPQRRSSCTRVFEIQESTTSGRSTPRQAEPKLNQTVVASLANKSHNRVLSQGRVPPYTPELIHLASEGKASRQSLEVPLTAQEVSHDADAWKIPSFMQNRTHTTGAGPSKRIKVPSSRPSSRASKNVQQAGISPPHSKAAKAPLPVETEPFDIDFTARTKSDTGHADGVHQVARRVRSVGPGTLARKRARTSENTISTVNILKVNSANDAAIQKNKQAERRPDASLRFDIDNVPAAKPWMGWEDLRDVLCLTGRTRSQERRGRETREKTG